MAKRFGQVSQPDFPAAVAGISGAEMREVIRQYYPGVDPFAFQEGCISHTADMRKEGIPEKPRTRKILEFFREQDVKLAVASSSGWEAYQCAEE